MGSLVLVSTQYTWLLTMLKWSASTTMTNSKRLTKCPYSTGALCSWYFAFLYAIFSLVCDVVFLSDRYVWESKADGAFAISEDTWNEPLGRGTEIRLHLRDEAKEYLEEDKLKVSPYFRVFFAVSAVYTFIKALLYFYLRPIESELYLKSITHRSSCPIVVFEAVHDNIHLLLWGIFLCNSLFNMIACFSGLGEEVL